MTQTLYLNPDLRIVHRKGNFFAVQLSGLTPPLPLAEPDFCLLGDFAGGREPGAVANHVATGGLARYFDGSPPAAHVLGRIRQMAQSRLLVPEAPSLPDSGAPMTISRARANGGALPDAILRLGSHFALEPARRGLRAWSSVTGSYHVLDDAMVLLLCAFGPGQPAPAVVAEKARLGERGDLERAVAWLLKCGLLVRAIHAPAGLDAAEQVNPVPDSESARDWRDIEPDGRIPIYFTPHMENHFPLALGMMYSAILAHDGGRLLERFQPLPITYMEPQELLDGPFRKFGPGIWLFSNYMWCLDINLQVSAAVKSLDPNNLCIHGGPSTPGYKQACTEFMEANPSVDVCVHGEGEVTVVELLECVARGTGGGIGFDARRLLGVHGLTYRAEGDAGLVWTPPRTRLRDLDVIPSPYLTGVFDVYRGRVEAAIIESNRGCPFGCTFCDWGSATRQKVRKFDLDRVRREIEWIGRKKIRVLWIADANFGMYDRDIELAKYIVAAKERLGYPREVVVNYTKNTNRRLIEIIRVFSAGGIISQGIISIQTTDEATLEVINRRNIKTEKYDELAEVFAQAKLPLSTDLMIGLPGITPEAWQKDLQKYFDADVSVKAYPTQLLPNSPMADPEYLEKYDIEVDENDFVVACHSFDRDDLARMKALYYAFEIADGYGVLRYVLRYLQWDHGIRALDFLRRLLQRVRQQPNRHPAVSWVLRMFLTEKSVPGGWRSFYSELGAYIREEYGIANDSALATALRVNAMAMPDDTLEYPLTEELEHDFEAWFRDHRSSADRARPLAEYPPGSFTVDDPDLLAHIDMDYLQYDSHQYFWELRSSIARPKSVSDVGERVPGRER